MPQQAPSEEVATLNAESHATSTIPDVSAPCVPRNLSVMPFVRKHNKTSSTRNDSHCSALPIKKQTQRFAHSHKLPYISPICSLNNDYCQIVTGSKGTTVTFKQTVVANFRNGGTYFVE